MQIVHFRILFFMVVLFSSLKAVSQPTGSIDLGADITVPTCQPCTTIQSVITAPNVGTSNYTVSQINYQPYSFLPGTIIPVFSDDVWSGVINMPFDFCFFGNTYNQLIAGSNGLISFNIGQANGGCPWSFAAVAPLPNTTYTSAHNAIMCPYHDLYPPAGGSMSYQTIGTAPNRVFVISWNLLPMFLGACNVLLNTQQIALYEGTNVIETYIANKDLCTQWNSGQAIHGIQNNGGTIAVIVPGRNLPNQWTATNDAWRFLPQPAGGGGGVPAGVSIEWFDVTNNIVLPDSTDSLNVCPNVTTTYKAVATFYLCGGVEKDSDEITIVKQLPLSLNVTNVTDANCFGNSDGSFTVVASGGTNSFTYTYNGIPMIGGTQSGLPAGTYNVVATDGANCTISTDVTINQPPEVILSIAEQIDVKCKYQKSGFVKLDAVGGIPGYLYWYGSNASSISPDMNYLEAGNYRFYVADSHGCLDSVDTYISQPDSLLNVYLIPHIATCISKKDGSVEAIASGGVPDYGYEWSSKPPQYSATATDLESGVYHVVVTDANGCITATQSPVEQQLCCQIFLPDAFSPNNDTKNDVYRILEYGGGVILGEFRIYNRWGQEIFSTREITKGWDGTFKGAQQNLDTYHYVVVYQCNEKGIISQKVKKGDFILVR
jgi:gliding motility-associated-like protein